MKEIPGYYNHARAEVAVFIPRTIKTILDIGCGQGAFLRFVKDKTRAETWGIEAEAAIAGMAVGRVDKLLTGNVEEQINFIPDEYFDCITFNDVLEYFTDPLEILKK